MDIDILPLATFVLVATFTPGPNNISSAAMGLAQGYQRTMGYLAGIWLGFLLVMVLCATLSATVLRAQPAFAGWVRWAGAAYIAWLAVGMLRSDYAMDGGGVGGRSLAKGFALQLLNPKVFVYGLTLFSTFLAPLAGQSAALLACSALLATMAFVATSTWALGGAAIRSRMQSPGFRRGLNAVLALLLAYTAADLALG